MEAKTNKTKTLNEMEPVPAVVLVLEQFQPFHPTQNGIGNYDAIKNSNYKWPQLDILLYSRAKLNMYVSARLAEGQDQVVNLSAGLESWHSTFNQVRKSQKLSRDVDSPTDAGADGPDFIDPVFDQALGYLDRFDWYNGLKIHFKWSPIKHMGSN